MSKVTWESNGKTYYATKIEVNDAVFFECQIREELEDLLKEGFEVRKIICPISVVRIMGITGIFNNYHSASTDMIFQIDRRLDYIIYFLYEEIDVKLIEATEFDGLDTLP